MDVRPGYKQTDVGVIPEDWGTDTLLRISRQIMDYRGRTPYRLASWARNSTDFYRWPQAAELLLKLGANPRLGVDANLQERELARATQMEGAAVTGTGGKP